MSPPLPLHGESSGGSRVWVIDVWADNEKAVLGRICGLARRFPIVAVATSQDVSAVPATSPRTLEGSYQEVRACVERVRLAQVGLAFLSREGELALGRVWRFHLGMEPGRADPYRLCEALWQWTRAAMPHGVCVTSDGAADMAYLVRYFNGGVLPLRRDGFLQRCRTFFPRLYDLKVLAEWRTVTDGEPPLAAAGADAFGRFLALVREWRFGRWIVGYNAFLSGLGAADDNCLISFKKIKAEHEEGRRRLEEHLLQFLDQEEVQNLFSTGVTISSYWTTL